MTDQFRDLRATSGSEVSEIENAFLRERAELLDTNKAEINALFEKRMKMERTYVEERQQREAMYRKEVRTIIDL